MVPELEITECRIPSTVVMLPVVWKQIKSPVPKQKAYENSLRSLYVIVTEEKYDGDWWRHISVSHPNAIPNWKEMCMVKDLFIGKDKKAIQIHPLKGEYYNLHPNVLHLWCNLDRDPLPNFLGAEGAI